MVATDKPFQVLLTRAFEQPALALLEAAGARVLTLACVRIEPPESWDELDAGLAAPADWWVMTSANAVRMVAARLEALGLGWPQVKYAAVGQVTAGLLRELTGQPVLVPARHNAAALAESLPPGEAIFWPHGQLAEPLPVPARGVVAYRTVPAELDEGQRALVQRADWVAVASGSAWQPLVGVLPRRARVATIGPKTSAVVRASGYEVAAEAEEASAEGLARAIISARTASR